MPHEKIFVVRHAKDANGTRVELKCFDRQGPHMLSKCPTKHEYYNRMVQGPWHTYHGARRQQKLVKPPKSTSITVDHMVPMRRIMPQIRTRTPNARLPREKEKICTKLVIKSHQRSDTTSLHAFNKSLTTSNIKIMRRISLNRGSKNQRGINWSDLRHRSPFPITPTMTMWCTHQCPHHTFSYTPSRLPKPYQRKVKSRRVHQTTPTRRGMNTTQPTKLWL